MSLKDGFIADQSAVAALHVAGGFFPRAILSWRAFLALFLLRGIFHRPDLLRIALPRPGKGHGVEGMELAQ